MITVTGIQMLKASREEKDYMQNLHHILQDQPRKLKIDEIILAYNSTGSM